MLIIDKNQKTNWKYILILLILAVIAGGGILKCYFEFSKITSSQIKILPSQKERKKAEEEVVIITDKTEYKTEETVKVTIKNNLGKSIWYYEWCINDCDKSLCECGDSFFVERREQNEYKVYSLPNSIYQEIMSPLVELKPNSEKTYQLKLIKFPKGTYRLGFFFGFNKKEPPRDVTIYSNEFEVSEEKINEISDWKTYRNEEYGFEIKFPKEYSLKENVEKMTEFGEKGKYAEILVNQKIINASCYEVSVEKIYVGINTTNNNFDVCAKEKIFSPTKNENELSILSIQLKDKGWLEEKVINGILFYRRYSMSQGMGGKSYLDFGYQTFFNDKCYKVGVEVSKNLYFGFKDECPPSLENSSIYQSLFKETDKKIQEIFFPIFSTFQLLSTTTEPEEVVREFFEWYFSDWRYQHRKEAIEREELTEEYRKELSEKFETTFTYDPVIFAQDIPDKGFTVGKASIGDKKALVVLTLKYSGMGEKNLLVELLLLNNQWKINNIFPILSENEIPRG